MGLWDTIMSDTVGTVYRATTGKPDPWTKDQILQGAIQDCVNAGGNQADCTQQQTQTVNDALNLPEMSWWSAFKSSFADDDGSGCGLTNIAGCMPPGVDLSWLPYILLGAGALALLWLIRPFVVAVEE